MHPGANASISAGNVCNRNQKLAQLDELEPQANRAAARAPAPGGGHKPTVTWCPAGGWWFQKEEAFEPATQKLKLEKVRMRCCCNLLLLCAATGAATGGTGGATRNIFAFHAGQYLEGKGYGPWEFYPWNRIQTVAVFGDHDPALVAKAVIEGPRFAVATDPDDVLDPKKTGKSLPNATARTAWVKSAVAAAQAVNATGINIDHEATMVEGSPQSAAFSAVISELGTALREAIPGAELSFDAAARPCYEQRCYNYSAIAAAVDRVFVMDYDLNDYDDPPPDNDHSRANAPLPTVQAGLTQLIAAGVPPEKIVCGLPWYGYVYKLTKGGKVLVSQVHQISFRLSRKSKNEARRTTISWASGQSNSCCRTHRGRRTGMRHRRRRTWSTQPTRPAGVRSGTTTRGRCG